MSACQTRLETNKVCFDQGATAKHWNRYQVNRVESVSGATGSALEKTRIDAMQYIETRPNTRFKKNIGA